MSSRLEIIVSSVANKQNDFRARWCRITVECFGESKQQLADQALTGNTLYCNSLLEPLAAKPNLLHKIDGFKVNSRMRRREIETRSLNQREEDRWSKGKANALFRK